MARACPITWSSDVAPWLRAAHSARTGRRGAACLGHLPRHPPRRPNEVLGRLRYPPGGWVGGGAEDPDPAAGVLDHREHASR